MVAIKSLLSLAFLAFVASAPTPKQDTDETLGQSEWSRLLLWSCQMAICNLRRHELTHNLLHRSLSTSRRSFLRKIQVLSSLIKDRHSLRILFK